MTLNTGTIVINRYRIVNLLGQGGFGAVYKAWDLNLNRACALKENLDTSSEAQRQFVREAQVLANLAHPNLPRVNDHFSVPGQGQYLVMELIEGEDLESKVQRRGPLALQQALHWIGQITDALQYMHSQQPPVIHRDIKPANIRITPEGRAILVDFGLAKIYDPHLKTTAGARAVTEGYSPPEQYGTGSTDARTDIYALAATLYALLTGQQPQESVQRIVDDQIGMVDQIAPQVSFYEAQVIQRAMSLSPSKRYQTALDFKTALIRSATMAMSSLPPIARPISPAVSPMGAILTASSRRKAVSLVALSAVLLIAGGLVLVNVSQVQQKAIDQANANSTVQADSLALALARQTEVGLTSTVQANQTATAFARQTATTRSSETATAQANSTATAQANAAATAQANAAATIQAHMLAVTAEAQAATATAETLLAQQTMIAQSTARAVAASTARSRATADAAAMASSSKTIVIQANLRWQGTNFYINVGDVVTVEYKSGQWTGGIGAGRWYDGRGDPVRYRCSGVATNCQEPMPSTYNGTLIGRVDTSYLEIGNYLRFTSKVAGSLFLRMNDQDEGLFDNDGSLTVQITISR